MSTSPTNPMPEREADQPDREVSQTDPEAGSPGRGAARAAGEAGAAGASRDVLGLVDELSQRLEDLRAWQQQNEQSLEAWQRQAESAEAERQSLADRLAELERTHGELDERQRVLDEREQALRQRRDELTREQNALAQRRAGLDDQQQELEDQARRLQEREQAVETERQQLDEERQSLEDERAAIERERRAAEEEKAAAERQLAETREQLEREQASLERERLEVDHQQQALQKERFDVKLRADSLARQQEHLDQVRQELVEQAASAGGATAADDPSAGSPSTDQASLEAREQELDERQQALDERARVLDAKKETLDQQQTSLEAQQASVETQRERLERLQATTQQRRARLRRYGQALRQRQRAIEQQAGAASTGGAGSAAGQAAPSADGGPGDQPAEPMDQQRQELAEIKRMLQVSERRMIRKWAGHRAGSLVAGVIVALAVLGGASWLAAGRVAPAMWRATMTLEAAGASGNGSVGLAPDGVKQAILSESVLANAWSRLAKAGVRGFGDQAAVAAALRERLQVEREAGQLVLRYDGPRRERVKPVLTAVGRAFTRHRHRQGASEGADAAGVTIAQSATVAGKPDRAPRIRAAGLIFAGLTGVSLLVCGAVYLALRRTAGVLDDPALELETLDQPGTWSPLQSDSAWS